MSSGASAPLLGQAPRVLVVVPTTGGPLLLRRLTPRPGLPHPAAFAEGHYRPLAQSADYRALAGPGGPVARYLGSPLPPHELRLSGEPDSGRSWETPVTLAHLLLAAGSTLVGDGEEADLVLWATGAVDLDLLLLPGDYALARKVEASRALLEAQGGRRTVAVLPPGPGQDEAAAALAILRRAIPVEVVMADAAGEALARLAAAPNETVISAHRSAPWSAVSWRWAVTAGAAVAIWLLSAAFGPEDAVDTGLAASVEALQGPGERDDPSPVRPDPSQAAGPGPHSSADRPPNSEPIAFEPLGSEPGTQAGAQASRVPEAPAVEPLAPAALIEVVRAAPGASCRAALFDPALRALRPVPRSGAGYAALTLDATVCGVALRPAAAGASFGPVTADPPGALVAAPPGDGTLVLFLSGTPRDVVYAVPVVREDGPPATIEHRLVAFPPDTSTE